MTKIGFVGLGAMGSRIAARLIASGHELQGHNRTPAKAEELIGKGMRWCESPREAAEGSELVISMVSDDAALEAVASRPDDILAGLSSGAVYVDMSTVSPATSVALAGRVRELGAEMLDAPVSGSVPQLEEGKLAIMVGGSEQAFARAEPVLGELGKVTRIGENGLGLVLKLAINVSIGAQMLAFSEGVLLAERGGIDRELAIEVMKESAIASPMLKVRAPLLLDLPDEAWFDVALMQKDIALALDAARKLAIPLLTAAPATRPSPWPAPSATSTATSPCYSRP
jgi:3-hydroxyisobutyrate dehydrogenase-like beta-hydroxyacid dehydrogenase